jgi:hypothetical protein
MKIEQLCSNIKYYYTMVATLWIHRLSEVGCDFLLYFGSRKDAYDFAIDFLNFHGDASERTLDWDYVTMDEDGDCHYLPSCPDLQMSIHDGKFFHAGWKERAGWAPQGTILLTPDEAMELGNTENPSDFVLDTDSVDHYPWCRNGEAQEASYYMRKTT